MDFPQPSFAPTLAVDALRLPQNIEAEQALLGALLIDNELVEEVQMRLKAQHFFEEVHGRIYEAILTMVDRNMAATPTTLKLKFDQDPALRELGGAAYLAQLAAAPGTLFGARDLARQVYDLALLRELIRVGRTMVDQALDMSHDLDPPAQIQEAEIALYRVAEQGDTAGGAKLFSQSLRTALESAERAKKSGGHVSGVTTGLTGLNEKIGGLHNSDLVILAGRPGMGKTALATNIAYAAAHRWMMDKQLGKSREDSVGAPAAFFSLEMSDDQLAARILADCSGVPSEKMRTGRMTDKELLQLVRAAGEIEELPFFIDDTPALTIAALRTRARRLKRQYGLGLIVVDYVQLLQGSAKSGDNRVQEISEITRGLKTLAKELHVPVLALSQLSRAVEQREDKRPLLSDLRESGSIEQDADIVMFVYREEYYHAAKKPEEGSEKFNAWLERGREMAGRAEVIVAKQRHGATGIVPVAFHSETTRFADAPMPGMEQSQPW